MEKCSEWLSPEVEGVTKRLRARKNTVQRGKKGPADAAVDWGGSRTSWQYSADSRAPLGEETKKNEGGRLAGRMDGVREGWKKWVQHA